MSLCIFFLLSWLKFASWVQQSIQKYLLIIGGIGHHRAEKKQYRKLSVMSRYHPSSTNRTKKVVSFIFHYFSLLYWWSETISKQNKYMLYRVLLWKFTNDKIIKCVFSFLFFVCLIFTQCICRVGCGGRFFIGKI